MLTFYMLGMTIIVSQIIFNFFYGSIYLYVFQPCIKFRKSNSTLRHNSNLLYFLLILLWGYLFFHFLLQKMLNTCKNKETSIHHYMIIINSWPLFFLYPPFFSHLPYWIILKQISHSIIMSSYIQYVSLKGRDSFLKHKEALFFIFKSSVYLKFIFEYGIIL